MIFKCAETIVQVRPPRDAPISWYTTVALEKMKEHGAIYLTPFSHRLAEEIDNHEYQRLRCRVNYHALRFKPHIMHLSNSIINQLRAQGHFMAIHLRFEMDMLAFAGYVHTLTLFSCIQGYNSIGWLYKYLFFFNGKVKFGIFGLSTCFTSTNINIHSSFASNIHFRAQ